MSTVKTGILGAVLLFSSVTCSAQSVVEMKPVDTLKVPNYTADGILEPVKCDSESNIYVQAFQRTEAGGRTPITKLSPDGKATVFPLPKVGDKELGILDFAPGADGGAVLLTTDHDAYYYVESYGEDGHFQSRFTLPSELEPMQIAVSPRGKVLICGLWWTGAAGSAERTSKSYAAVFGSAGRVEREIDLTRDTQGNTASGAPAEGGSRRAESDRRRTMSFSSAQFSATEGFVLARLGSSGSIDTVSPDGFETNELHLSSPPESQLTDVQVDGNTIAALFVKKRKDSTQNEISDVFISLIDSQSGDERQRFHHSSWELGAALACYRHEVFTFLRAGENNELLLVRASAK